MIQNFIAFFIQPKLLVLHVKPICSSYLSEPFQVNWEIRINQKKTKKRLLPIFSPDFTLNSQIWLCYAEKWIFLKKLLSQELCLTHSPLETLLKNAF